MGWLREWTGHWVDANSQHFLYAPIPRAHTDDTFTYSALEPYASYLRLWLAEMHLAKGRAWGTKWFPAVNAEVRLTFAGNNTVTFPSVLRLPDDKLGQGVQLNYRLTELLPYEGGVVEIDSALFALPRSGNFLATALDALQSFSGLIAPPLGQALGISGKVAASVHSLLLDAQAGVHLAFHQQFVSAGGADNVLRPGYHCVVLASPTTIDRQRLSVRTGQLYYTADAGAAPAPLNGYDYMLFRVESRPERDDWRLPDIDAPLRQAVIAANQGDQARASAYRLVAQAAAGNSADLSVADRRRVVTAIKEEVEAALGSGKGVTGAAPHSLDEVMASRAMPLRKAVAFGELTSAEIYT
jgi:hypothetical protein